MNRIFKTMPAAVVFVAVACVGHMDTDLIQVADDKLVTTTFYASTGPDTKTTYNDRSVYWEETDVIDIFSGSGWLKTHATIATLSETRQSAVFTGLAVEGTGSYCAVYPQNDANTFDGTTLSVNIPSEQTAVEGGFLSGANVSVAFTGRNTFSFRNVGGLLGFRFKTASDASRTASVTFRARTSEEDPELLHGLSGQTSVTFNEAGVPSATSGSTDYVTLLAPDGGFQPAVTYYMVVLPGEFKGVDITYTTTSGETVTRSNESDAVLLRNEVLNIGQLNEPYDILPEEFTISLDFTSDTNPLGAFNKIADQSTEGDTYSYHYLFDGGNEDLNFIITKGTQRSTANTAAAGYYQHIKPTESAASGMETKVLYVVCASGDTKISLPAVPGRYLKSVSVGMLNTENRRFRLQNSVMNRYVSSDWIKAASITEKSSATISFPNDAASFPNTTVGVGYIIQLTDKANYYITDITATYTRSEPVAEADPLK